MIPLLIRDLFLGSLGVEMVVSADRWLQLQTCYFPILLRSTSRARPLARLPVRFLLPLPSPTLS